MQRIDKGLFFAMIGLTIFGLIMMSSMSIAESFDVTGKNDFYFWRHFLRILISVPIFIAAFLCPSQALKKGSAFGYVICIGLLTLTLMRGESYGTAATLWLKLGPLSIQPVEFAKLGVVIFLAAIFSSGHNNAQTLERGFFPFVIILAIPALLIIAQPDFGALLVLMIAASAIYFVAGANPKHFFGGLLATGLGGLIVVLTTPYINHRFRVFLDPTLDPLNTGFQVKQALIAIGSGGAFGRGFQNSIQKFDYLPEVQSDTIFAAISEELGFFRILILIGIYLYIAYRGYKIAQAAPDEFNKLLAVGVTTWIVGQAFVNIGVNLALLPNTGITLPLISYGGSSLMVTLAGIGLLLHISTLIQERPSRRRYW